MALEPDARGQPRAVAEADVGEGTRETAVEEDRVYVSTRDAVVVLDSEDLEVLETPKLGPLAEGTQVRYAEASSLVVGEEDAYLSLAGSPYVLRLGKSWASPGLSGWLRIRYRAFIGR